MLLERCWEGAAGAMPTDLVSPCRTLQPPGRPERDPTQDRFLGFTEKRVSWAPGLGLEGPQMDPLDRGSQTDPHTERPGRLAVLQDKPGS